MGKILRMGRLLKTNKSGFIVSESNVGKIASPWREAVEEIKNSYLKNLGDIVHSIYVRGTVSRGDAIKGISDIDTFAVVLKKLEEVDRTWVKESRKELEKKHSFSTRIEIQLLPYEELFNEEKFFNDRFTIKTQSACVYGEDLALKISPFKADIETASHFFRNLKIVIEKTKKGVKDNLDKEDIKEKCRWVMKRIIRAGFVLVMDKEQVFTRDLYPSYKLFSKHHPKQEPKMKIALDMAINPTDYSDKTISFLDDFGVWIENQVEGKFVTSLGLSRQRNHQLQST